MSKIISWLGGKALFGLYGWMWAGIAVAALTGGILWLQARENADDKANQEIGAGLQRESDLRKTLQRTEQGNDARSEIEQDLETNDGFSCTVYNQCLRTARTPSNCKRFLPERETDQCGAAPR